MPKRLVIVESPTKAKTIEKYLGKDYVVTCECRPYSRSPQQSQSGARLTRKKQADRHRHRRRLSGNLRPRRGQKEATIREIASALEKTADELYLATDADREGEAISWHLLEVLKPKKKAYPVKRLRLGQITKSALQKAIEEPEELDSAIGRGSGNPPTGRPSLWLPGIQSALAQGGAGPLGRTRPDRGDSTSGRPRKRTPDLSTAPPSGIIDAIFQTPAGGEL